MHLDDGNPVFSESGSSQPGIEGGGAVPGDFEPELGLGQSPFPGWRNSTAFGNEVTGRGGSS